MPLSLKLLKLNKNKAHSLTFAGFTPLATRFHILIEQSFLIKQKTHSSCATGITHECYTLYMHYTHILKIFQVRFYKDVHFSQTKTFYCSQSAQRYYYIPKYPAISFIRSDCFTLNGQRLSQCPQETQSDACFPSLE